MEININKLNSILKDLRTFRRNTTPFQTDVVVECHGNSEDQGSEGEKYEVYEFENDVFVQMKITTDSYGNNEELCGIQLVVPKEKIVYTFKPLQ